MWIDFNLDSTYSFSSSKNWKKLKSKVDYNQSTLVETGYKSGSCICHFFMEYEREFEIIAVFACIPRHSKPLKVVVVKCQRYANSAQNNILRRL